MWKNFILLREKNESYKLSFYLERIEMFFKRWRFDLVFINFV